jgi:hypothetical protein
MSSYSQRIAEIPLSAINSTPRAANADAITSKCFNKREFLAASLILSRTADILTSFEIATLALKDPESKGASPCQRAKYQSLRKSGTASSSEDTAPELDPTEPTSAKST